MQVPRLRQAIANVGEMMQQVVFRDLLCRAYTLHGCTMRRPLSKHLNRTIVTLCANVYLKPLDFSGVFFKAGYHIIYPTNAATFLNTRKKTIPLKTANNKVAKNTSLVPKHLK